MNDYKELIDTLKKLSNKPETYQALFYTAADAIEQLVRERDAAMADLKESADCQVCKFYDAEDVVCIAKNCRCGEDWEWRGVQE